jgi:hypothetical protein
MVKNDPAAVLDIDRELGERVGGALSGLSSTALKG